MQDRELGGGKREGAFVPSPAHVEHRVKPPSPAEQPLRCPRCDSLNTKFCYYNNYSQSQPRHFCKGCRRYWTNGGTLRNVPVGGGCRKNKRPRQRSTQHHQAPPSAHHHDTLPTQPPPSTSTAFYTLSNFANQLDLSSFPGSTQPASSGCSAIFGDVSSTQLPPFSSQARLHHLRSNVLGLDYPGVGELGTFLESSPLQLAPPSSAPSEGLRSRLADGFNDMYPIAKLALGLEENHMMDGHVLTGLQSEEQQPVERLRQSFLPIKLDEGSPSCSGFYGQTPEVSSFWNNTSTWPNLNPYTTSASPFL